MSVKILTVIGARPQFIKAAAVSRVLQSNDQIEETIVHTGQHYDRNMSQVFFEQLSIPRPDHYLGIAGLDHGAMTGRMLEGIEFLIQKLRPDWVLVYGDTNSTLAGALAAAKLHIPIAHVEAGLRSFNPAMPEEINRIITDRVSTLLLCPTQTALDNLRHEGFPFPSVRFDGEIKTQNVSFIGDVMYDATLYYREVAKRQINLEDFGVKHKQYAICTLHRQENTDNPTRLASILSALRAIANDQHLLMPLHPRTQQKIEQQLSADQLKGINVMEPLAYLEMQRLLMSASIILTDSGGMQKEAYFHDVPCITLRNETEWIETVETGRNILVGADFEKIYSASISMVKPLKNIQKTPFGTGQATLKIPNLLLNG